MSIKKQKSSNYQGKDEASFLLSDLEHMAVKVAYEAGSTINNSYKTHAGQALQQGDGRVMATYRQNKMKLELMREKHGF